MKLCSDNTFVRDKPGGLCVSCSPQQHVFEKYRVWHWRPVRIFRVTRMACSVIENTLSSMACIDLGLLVIANVIMRTRLPARIRTAEKSSVLTELLTDVPYIVYMCGSFLVSTTYRKRRLIETRRFYRFNGDNLYRVSWESNITRCG